MREMWILKTLVGKEVLRYRRVWGPLVLVGALVALAAVMSASAKSNTLPGATGGAAISDCIIWAQSNDPLAAHLKEVAAATNGQFDGIKIEFKPPRGRTPPPRLPVRMMGIELFRSQGRSKAVFWVLADGQTRSYVIRDWFAKHAREFLKGDPGYDDRTGEALPLVDVSDQAAIVMTILMVFCTYLTSFSLYVTSMSEERERRVLLAILMTPATPGLVVAAKLVFHLALSMASVGAVAAAYKPELLADPFLWWTVFLGSVSYLSIATVLFCVVQRYATLNSVPMLYLVVTSVINLLADPFPPMRLVQAFLTDAYVFRLFQAVCSGANQQFHAVNLLSLTFLTGVWAIVALRLFSRYAHEMCKGR